MPTVSGTIRFKDFTVFITAPHVELRRAVPHPGLQQILSQLGPALGLITDMDADGAPRVLDLLTENVQAFVEHLHAAMPAAQPIVGLSVWQGGLTVDAEGGVLFEGVVRRPTTSDYGALEDLLGRIDAEAQKDALEHAKKCRGCAEKMGLDPSEVEEGDEEVDPGVHLVRFGITPGEA